MAFEPKVELIGHFETKPFDVTVGAARSCYSKKFVDARQLRRFNTTEQAWAERQRQEQEYIEKWSGFVGGLREAGHLTTHQHSHMMFRIEGVSRHCIWSFLHAHPFYNSEQVSQRYVEVKEGSFVVPSLEGGALELFLEGIHRLEKGYNIMQDMLDEGIRAEYGKRFTGRLQTKDERKMKQWENDLHKRKMEAARYLLPVATTAFMYHTIPAISVLRYHEMMHQFDTPEETRAVIDAMMTASQKYDPDFFKKKDPIPLEDTPEFKFMQEWFPKGKNAYAKEFTDEFDASLGGRISQLVSWDAKGEKNLADTVREVFALPSRMLSDDEAIRRVMDPSLNDYHGNMLDVHTLSKLGRALHTVTYGFKKKLSHTADSQNQRHRTIQGPRGIIAAHIMDNPDCVWPTIFLREPKLQKYASELAEQTWETMGKLQKMGVSFEKAQYLLPNATALRFRETGTLLNFTQKLGKRLCYNAQEEIWRASLDEARQITEIHPRIGKWLSAPCESREVAGIKPACPEGPRYCGIPVWRFKGLEDYQRVI